MRIILRAIPVILAVIGAGAIALWLRASPSMNLEQRMELPSRKVLQSTVVKFPGEFAPADGKPAAELTGSWPCFRGEARDAVSREQVPLARSWGPQGPKVLWKAPMGIGYAGPAVRNGRVYVLDYDEARQADALRCLSLADGREIWRRWYEIPIDSDHGVSRTVPAVTDKYVVTLGPKCHVLCVDATTGDFRWGLDLIKDYKTIVPKWYAGQCPLIDKDRAILAPAGDKVLMMAVDCETGKTVWQTPNAHGWKMTHASITPVDFKGRRMYVYCASGGVAGVAAEDGPSWKAGDVLWERDDWRVTFACVPSPVVVGDGKILLAGGYGSGAMMIQLKEEGGKITSEKVWRLEKSKDFGAEQQTPVFLDGYVYGVLPKEAGSLGGQLVCIDLEGKHKWTSGGANRFGLGPWMIADGLLFVMDDNGLLTMAEAKPGGYRPVGQARVLPGGHETWAPMTLAGGRLLVRDLKQMVCLDVRKE